VTKLETWFFVIIPCLDIISIFFHYLPVLERRRLGLMFEQLVKYYSLAGNEMIYDLYGRVHDHLGKI
jgi:hypothetical protein